jgi:hypothetical protein
MGRLIHDEKIKVITPPGPDPRKVHDLNRVLEYVQSRYARVFVRCVYGLSGWSCLRSLIQEHIYSRIRVRSREYESYGQGIRCDVGQEQHRTISAPQWYGDTFGCGEADAEQTVSTPSLKLG